jgi:NAD(P)-dependent dehydrogenase (short-subunit alcohol dehydrogenase family)
MRENAMALSDKVAFITDGGDGMGQLAARKWAGECVAGFPK